MPYSIEGVRVLVTDGEQRSALAVVRSLGRAGCAVHVCSSRRHPLAGASRHTTRTAQVADALDQPQRFATDVAALVDSWDIQVVLPVSEPSLLAVLAQPESFADVTVPFPALPEFTRACDKAAVARLAESVGIRVPKQHHAATPDEAAGVRVMLRFPLVVKPSRSVIGNGSGRWKSSVVHVADERALDTALTALPAAAYPVLLQERITGPGTGVFLLLRAGVVIASFCHRRIREKPPSGGVSVYCESVPLDAALLERSVALLRALSWEGVAMVEYKRDAESGEPYLMEINGRFWGSLQLAIDAGVDFPALLVAASLGRRPSPVHAYRAGVRSRWFWGDVDQLLLRLRHGAEQLSLPPDAGGRARAIGEFLTTFLTRARSDVLRISDPAPALRETRDWLRGR